MDEDVVEADLFDRNKNNYGLQVIKADDRDKYRDNLRAKLATNKKINSALPAEQEESSYQSKAIRHGSVGERVDPYDDEINVETMAEVDAFDEDSFLDGLEDEGKKSLERRPSVERTAYRASRSKSVDESKGSRRGSKNSLSGSQGHLQTGDYSRSGSADSQAERTGHRASRSKSVDESKGSRRGSKNSLSGSQGSLSGSKRGLSTSTSSIDRSVKLYESNKSLSTSAVSLESDSELEKKISLDLYKRGVGSTSSLGSFGGSKSGLSGSESYLGGKTGDMGGKRLSFGGSVGALGSGKEDKGGEDLLYSSFSGPGKGLSRSVGFLEGNADMDEMKGLVEDKGTDLGRNTGSMGSGEMNGDKDSFGSKNRKQSGSAGSLSGRKVSSGEKKDSADGKRTNLGGSLGTIGSGKEDKLGGKRLFLVEQEKQLSKK